MAAFYNEVKGYNRCGFPANLPDLLGEQMFEQVYPIAVENFLTTSFVDANNRSQYPLDLFMKKDGVLLSKYEKDYIFKLKASSMSLYEVQEVDRGKSMLLKNLLVDEEPKLVYENLGTEQMTKWSIIATRVIEDLDTKYCCSAAILKFPRELLDDILSRCEELQDPQLNPKILATLWLNYYLNLSDATLSERMLNFDGHQIRNSTLKFPLKAKLEQIAAKLDELENFVRVDDDYCWQIHRDSQSEQGLCLAGVIVDAKWLSVQTNSIERAEDLRARLQQELSGLVGTGLIATEDLDMEMDRFDQSDSGGEDFVRDTVALEQVLNYKEQYYRSMLDEQIPMLAGLSPREASRTEDGRRQLVDLLKYYENTEGQQELDTGMPAYDFTWIKEELGVEV